MTRSLISCRRKKSSMTWERPGRNRISSLSADQSARRRRPFTRRTLRAPTTQHARYSPEGGSSGLKPLSSNSRTASDSISTIHASNVHGRIAPEADVFGGPLALACLVAGAPTNGAASFSWTSFSWRTASHARAAISPCARHHLFRRQFARQACSRLLVEVVDLPHACLRASLGEMDRPLLLETTRAHWIRRVRRRHRLARSRQQ